MTKEKEEANKTEEKFNKEKTKSKLNNEIISEDKKSINKELKIETITIAMAVKAKDKNEKETIEEFEIRTNKGNKDFERLSDIDNQSKKDKIEENIIISEMKKNKQLILIEERNIIKSESYEEKLDEGNKEKVKNEIIKSIKLNSIESTVDKNSAK